MRKEPIIEQQINDQLQRKFLLFLVLVILGEGVYLFKLTKERDQRVSQKKYSVQQDAILTLSPSVQQVVEKPPIYEIPTDNTVQVEVMGRLQEINDDTLAISSEDGQNTVWVRITDGSNFFLRDSNKDDSSPFIAISWDQLKKRASKRDKVAVNSVFKESDQMYVSQGSILVDKIGDFINY